MQNGSPGFYIPTHVRRIRKLEITKCDIQSGENGITQTAVSVHETRRCNVIKRFNSDRAIMVNIQIIRVFTKMRGLLQTHKEILQKLEEIERKEIEQDQKIILIFEYLKLFEESKQQQLEQAHRKKLGYTLPDKKQK